MKKASFSKPSMDFYLISSNNKDITISSKLDVIVIPMLITRLSCEFCKENNKIMHLSSSNILILIEAN